MNKAILSTEHPQFADRLRQLGYDIIPSDEIPCKMPYERRHADLQCLIIHGQAFVLQGCTALIKALCVHLPVMTCGEDFGGAYPDNVCLNALYLSNQLICRTASLDPAVRGFCRQNGIALIPVNQGYAKCSCAVVSDDALITADKGILRTLADRSLDVLPIGEGGVFLNGCDSGFIGGASGYDKCRKTLYFCGDISRHPDGDRIKNFCEDHGTKAVSLTDAELIDIGGILFC